jgi:hypothetical protein
MVRAIAALLIALLGLPMAVSAEVREVQIARGFAIPHLPIMFSVYEERKHSWVRMPDDIEHMP